MKKKILSLFMAAVVIVSMLAITGITASAATVTNTQGLLNNQLVSFNGGANQTIQCYNLDGYNFYRVRNIVAPLNFAVSGPVALDTANSIMVSTNDTYGTVVALPTLTTSPVTVGLTTANVYWDGTYTAVGNFNLADYNYYKIADLALASQNTLSQRMKNVETGSSVYKPTTSNQYVTVITATYTDADKVTHINSVKCDLLAYWNYKWSGGAKPTFMTTLGLTGSGGGTTPTPTPTPTPTNPPVTPGNSTNTVTAANYPAYVSTYAYNSKPTALATPTSAPPVGAILARVLVNSSLSPYTNQSTGLVNDNNIMPAYGANGGGAGTTLGQCWWYAASRFYETTGINISPLVAGVSYSTMVNNAVAGKYSGLSGSTSQTAVKARSIAIWNGHVVFVEYVTMSGATPVTVYFTEANYNHTGSYTAGVYYPAYDGQVKSLSYADFINHSSGFLGYIYAK